MTEAETKLISGIKELISKSIDFESDQLSYLVDGTVTEYLDSVDWDKHISNYLDDTDYSDCVSSSVDCWMDNNYLDTLRYSLESSDCFSDAVENYMNKNGTKLIRDFFTSDEGKSIVRNVFASLVKEE